MGTYLPGLNPSQTVLCTLLPLGQKRPFITRQDGDVTQASECRGLLHPLRGAKSFMRQRARVAGDLLPRKHFRDSVEIDSSKRPHQLAGGLRLSLGCMRGTH